MEKFFNMQSEKNKNLYVDLLKITGSLSNLFADTKTPFLYYRAMENIFCKAFEADNLSRSDISADAGKNGIGIGLKTFLHSNGNTFQKVAEFNKESYLLKNLTSMELIKKVSEMRNERIKTTMRICEFSDMIYHLITRSENEMKIYEEHMDLIDIEKIKIIKEKTTTIEFFDGKHYYNYNLSKSTLLKRFVTLNLPEKNFSINILEDPYDFLLSIDKNRTRINREYISLKGIENEVEDYIVLPLYSPKENKVQEKSGLNQWNANGRKRDYNEVYIPIPSIIHKKKEEFFNYNTDDKKTAPFNVKLPNGKTLSMKVAQQGGKALMSNPNSALGEWILRDILQLKEAELLTKEKLDTIGIDSVKLSKLKNGNYYLDFIKTGSYEEFEENL